MKFEDLNWKIVIFHKVFNKSHVKVGRTSIPKRRRSIFNGSFIVSKVSVT